jgi:hypothetical protein
MKKIFIIIPHNNPSGGTKVANQVVNLFREKKFESFLVTLEAEPKRADFMKEPAPVISLADFKKTCAAEDIAITFWQHREILEAVKGCPAAQKIFWQHGIIIPRYRDFNGEEYFQPGIFTAYWNVSAACAEYIKKKYNLPLVKIVHPFFDDQTLLEYFQKKEEYKREGILILRRRGQEAIPDIISAFPRQKITILEKIFHDDHFYAELIKHEFFISTDNGINGAPLIKNRWRRWLKKSRTDFREFFKGDDGGQMSWIKPEKNLLGFPVSACEAAWLGTTVIGFAMGGGLEWMNENNMYLAKDGDIYSLLEKIGAALNDSRDKRETKKSLAELAVKKFSRENVWQDLAKNLNLS